MDAPGDVAAPGLAAICDWGNGDAGLGDARIGCCLAWLKTGCCGIVGEGECCACGEKALRWGAAGA